MIGALVLLFSLATPTFEQRLKQVTPPSPCPDVFQYEPVIVDPAAPPNRWYGTFNLTTDSTLRFLWVNIALDKKSDLFGTAFGEVTTRDNQNFRIESTERITPGYPFPVRFYVKFNLLQPGAKTPMLKSIRVNGRVVCDAEAVPPEEIQVTLPVKSNRSLVLNNEVRPSELSLGNRPGIPASNFPTNVGDKTDNTPMIIFGGYRPTIVVPTSQVKCGTIANKAAPLVTNGIRTLEGEWPWQIALFFLDKGGEGKFLCGGTLVSHRQVITAAHCVTYQTTKTVADKNQFLVHLGKHNLKTSVRGVQIRKLEAILVNPDYNPTTLDRDAAILQLEAPVTYTDWVRPACLWPDSLIDPSNIVGRSGATVGWGFDSTNMITDELNLVEMPVVDVLTCLKSYESFFSRFISEYTYCAGHRNGSSVCNGDSGGGMVFRIDGAWHLRGLVTLSALRQDDRVLCDPTNYVIFTDLAKLLPWIRDNVYDF